MVLTALPVEGLMGVPDPATVRMVETSQVTEVDLVYDTGIR
jgi:hypothetical protein